MELEGLEVTFIAEHNQYAIGTIVKTKSIYDDSQVLIDIEVDGEIYENVDFARVLGINYR